MSKDVMTNNALMISERFPPDIGGVAKSAQRTVLRMRQIGVRCDVFSWTKTIPPGQLESKPAILPGLGEELADADLPIHHRFGMFGNFDLTMQHSMNVIQWLHKTHQFRFCWGHYLFPAGFMATLQAGIENMPSIVSARGNDIDRLIFPPGDFSRLLWTLQRSDIVTSVSHDLAKKIQVLDPAIQPKVIHNSVSTELFKPAPPCEDLRKELGIYPGEKVLGFCGELRHKKGLPFILSALEELAEQRSVCLLVIGTVRQSDLSAIFEGIPGGEKSRRRVIVSGPIDTPEEIAKHLNLCDLVLSPSVWDGLPNSVLEAMACEKLVLASDSGGHPEVIQHGKDGLLIPKTHLNQLSTAISECLDLPLEEREKIQKAAREKILTQFRPENEQACLKQILAPILSE